MNGRIQRIVWTENESNCDEISYSDVSPIRYIYKVINFVLKSKRNVSRFRWVYSVVGIHSRSHFSRYTQHLFNQILATTIIMIIRSNASGQIRRIVWAKFETNNWMGILIEIIRSYMSNHERMKIE
eukprot:772717_1